MSPWSLESLDKEQKRLITGSLIYQLVKQTFTTHVYMWEGEIYLQVKGAPIGLRASGIVVWILMDWWARRFKELANKATAKHEINPVAYEGGEYPPPQKVRG